MKIKNNISAGFLTLSLLSAAAFVSSQAQAGWLSAGHHTGHGNKMMQQLDLTDSQQQQIDNIRDKYKKQIKQARKDGNKGQMQTSIEAMKSEISQLLSDDQKQQLVTLKQQRVEKFSKKMSKRLTHKLDLDDTQQQSLTNLIEQQTAQHKKRITSAQSVDIDQMKSVRQQDKKALDELFANILNQEQQEEWQEIKQKMERFANKHGRRGEGKKQRKAHHHDCDESSDED